MVYSMPWYALYTTPRAEKKVKERLDAAGIENFLPLHLAPRQWSDRIKMVEIPLFPSYIFVNAEEHQLRALLQLYGVTRAVYHCGRPAIILDKEIKAIRKFLEKAATYAVSFTIGDDVLIACGPLKDISGKITKIGKSKMVLHLEQLATTVCVDLDKVVKK